MSGHYARDIALTANTGQSSPSDTEFVLTAGTLTKITIGFPAGAGGLAHIQILEESNVIFPTLPDSSYAWDDYVFTIETLIQIDKTRNTFIVRGWNTDNLYQHTINIAFNVIPSDNELPTFLNTLKRMVLG